MSTPQDAAYPPLSESLRNVYLLQVRLTLADTRMQVLQAKPAVRALIEAAPDTAAGIHALAEAFVPEESRKACEDFSDLGTLPQRLAENPEHYLTFVFHALDGRFLLATTLPETKAPDGSLASVLILVRDATPQVTERHIAQENLVHAYAQLEESVNILHSLQNIYFTGFYVDIPANRYKALFIAPWLTAVTPQEGRFSSLVQAYLNSYVVPEDRAELSSKLTAAYIRSSLQRENLSLVRQSFNVDYRSIRFGQERWCRLSVIAVDLDETGSTRVQDLIGSPLYLRQILLNLSTNALKYNKPNGWIRVECRELSATRDTALYEFVCADGGIGMSMDFQKKMFEPFSQERQDARTSYNGTGLGLAITKGLVEKMGGRITVKSEKGKGTAFTVRIPFAIDHTAHRPDAGHPAAPAGSLKGLRVLLVEDNDLNAEVAQFLLEQEGMTVELARNGQLAVKAFEAHAPRRAGRHPDGHHDAGDGRLCRHPGHPAAAAPGCPHHPHPGHDGQCL